MRRVSPTYGHLGHDCSISRAQQWDRLYFELVPPPVATSRTALCAVISTPSQCLPSIRRASPSHSPELESRSGTLILGCLTAIDYLCPVVTPSRRVRTSSKATASHRSSEPTSSCTAAGLKSVAGTTAQRFSANT
uniref:Uncharacterized protein n=1 Tax=Macrostomum lignano TaxID=282301 RepID=A0A1I8FD61_9PLAT